MHKDSKIYIAGHKGMVGNAVWNLLKTKGYQNLIGKSRKDLDLRNQKSVAHFFKNERPEIVINAAAIVGGIVANNNNPYQFLLHNMQIQNNLINIALESNIEKFVFLGSSCIYPKLSPQPIAESSLLGGYLEPTNEWYAIAKISGIKLCEAIQRQYNKYFISLMPTNLYGSFDNFDLENSHVIPAMIRKFHEAKLNNHTPVTLWGSGVPKREFLHVTDLAEAIVFSLENTLPNPCYNIGTGVDISIKNLALIIQKITGHKGEIQWNQSKPDGTPRKLLDISAIQKEGWSPKISLSKGLESTYEWFSSIETYKEISSY